MGNRRALLTDREREIVAGEADVSDSYRYQTISRVRARFDRLEGDLQALKKHGDLLKELRDVVCEDDVSPVDSSEEEHDVSNEGRVNEMRDAIKEADEIDRNEAHEVAERFEETPAGIDLPAESEISEEVWNVVDGVAARWDDEPARLETRRKAAGTALQYALTHDIHLGKSNDAVEAIREKYPVEGQNAETWWRKNIRGVLKEVGTYSNGHHGYAVEDLEVEDD